MARRLKELRAKLKELNPPADASGKTKAFIRKHVYVLHPDATGNGDDVYKASNVKKYKRAPDHGYEPGEDADIYEGAYSRIDADKKEKTRLNRVKDSVTMKKGRTRATDLEDDHRVSRRMEAQRLKDRMRSEEAIDESIPFAAALSSSIRTGRSKSLSPTRSRTTKPTKSKVGKPEAYDPTTERKIARMASHKSDMSYWNDRKAAKSYYGDYDDASYWKKEEFEEIGPLETLYLTLDEDNKEKFLGMVASDEGRDLLLDFVITRRLQESDEAIDHIEKKKNTRFVGKEPHYDHGKETRRIRAAKRAERQREGGNHKG